MLWRIQLEKFSNARRTKGSPQQLQWLLSAGDSYPFCHLSQNLCISHIYIYAYMVLHISTSFDSDSLA